MSPPFGRLAHLHRGHGGLGLAAVLCGLAVLPAMHAEAQCEEPAWGPMEVTPAVGAPGVTTDAWVMVRYRDGYFGPEGPGEDPSTLVTLNACGSCGASCDAPVPVSGSVQVFGDDLFFVPDGPLDPRTQYEGEARGLESGLTMRFCTGSAADAAPPSFGSQSVTWSSEEVGPSCELPDGGFRVGIFTQSAADDGPGGSLEYLLFLTRADGLEAPMLVDRVRNFAAGEITLRLFLDGEQAASPVCVRLAVVDGVGNVTMSEDEVCFDPVSKITFQGCNVRPGIGSRTTTTTATTLAMGLLALLVGRRASRRRPWERRV
jgi:hypothetical protein